MDPEGTPNPLNPASGTASATGTPQPGAGMAVGTGRPGYTDSTVGAGYANSANKTGYAGSAARAGYAGSAAKTNYVDSVARPASFAQSTAQSGYNSTSNYGSNAPAASAMPEMAKVAPASAMPNIPVAKPSAPTSRGVVDPMMRPAQHKDTSSYSQSSAADDLQGFDTLDMNDDALNDLRGKDSLSASAAEFVAKDSVVEPAKNKCKGSKKKPLIICAIILVIVAIVCGAAAIAILVLGNNGDRISKAIDRLIDGETSSIITVKGYVSSSNSASSDTSSFSNGGLMSAASTTIELNGTFDTKSSMNEVTAGVTGEFANGSEMNFEINELTTKDGDTFVKFSGLSNILSPIIMGVLNTPAETPANIEQIAAEQCGDDMDCQAEYLHSTGSTTDLSETLDTLNLYSGLLDVADSEWILISDDFSDAMSNITLFDNSSTCLINAFGTLGDYSKDIASKYQANPFITYSTDNLAIAKKKDTLYRLGVDDEKLSAFANSLGNNGFINELNACSGATATNTGTNASFIKEIFKDMPALYVEVDDNYNFTRVYLTTSVEADGITTTSTADLSLSYPAELKINEPDDYITMSTLLNNVMNSLISGGETE